MIIGARGVISDVECVSSSVIIIICKKLTNKYTENLEFSTRVGTIAHRQKVLKQAGVVHDVKSQ